MDLVLPTEKVDLAFQREKLDLVFPTEKVDLAFPREKLDLVLPIEKVDLPLRNSLPAPLLLPSWEGLGVGLVGSGFTEDIQSSILELVPHDKNYGLRERKPLVKNR